ncbi:hypothetical protein [Variovorax guangxiensis]|uniref:hypothetical protein n=1 Tax=Variovorax guangxiensis TaxID=1775474 RepID=UPI001F501125|nr:hypothetical protein [Variovorax guangxiensis]
MKSVHALAIERQAIDPEAWGLVLGQSCDGGLRLARQACIHGTFLLVAQRPLTFLLAEFFDEGLGRRRVVLRDGTGGRQQSAKAEDNAKRRARAPGRERHVGLDKTAKTPRPGIVLLQQQLKCQQYLIRCVTLQLKYAIA